MDRASAQARAPRRRSIALPKSISESGEHPYGPALKLFAHHSI